MTIRLIVYLLFDCEVLKLLWKSVFSYYFIVCFKEEFYNVGVFYIFLKY